MIFSKFFKKDHRHYLKLAAKQLAAERFADARADYEEALQRCPADAHQEREEIVAGIARAADALGELNLREAEHSLNAGDLAKAFDHYTLASELAVDHAIKARALAALDRLEDQDAAAAAAPSAKSSGHGGSCASCADAGSHRAPAEEGGYGDHLSDEERFELMVQPLPCGLASRYLALGPDFQRAYLLIHDGHDDQALFILQEMLLSGDNDIVIYEVALIMYRAQRLHECEEMFKCSLALNPENGASYLALVHLLAENERYAEASETLQRMLATGVLVDQAHLMLGDLYQITGEEALAVEAWSKSLEFPGVAKQAAQRLVPLLSGQGRQDEAKYLTKRYLQGCC